MNQQLFNVPASAGYTVDEYTPQWLIDALGGAEFDPCAGTYPDGSITTIGSVINWPKRDDGLNREWPKEFFGFVNPPFDQKPAVIRKCAQHGNCILLLPITAYAQWQEPAFELSDAAFYLFTRVQFVNPNRLKNPSKFSTWLFLFGNEAIKRVKNSGLRGSLMAQMPRP